MAETIAVDPATGGQKIAEVVPEGLLSDREGLVLRLTFERDLQGPDIAQVLGISENTVRVLKARALKKLRDAGLRPDGTFPDDRHADHDTASATTDDRPAGDKA